MTTTIEEHVDASASCNVSIVNTHEDTQEVYTKEVAVTGLHSIAPNANESSVKITVCFDLSAKSYGNGAAIMCSVTLNARQDEDAVREGYALARIICEEEGAEALKIAKATFDRVQRAEG